MIGVSFAFVLVVRGMIVKVGASHPHPAARDAAAHECKDEKHQRYQRGEQGLRCAAATRASAPPRVPTCALDGNTTVAVTTQTEYDLKVLQGTFNTLVVSLVIAIGMYAFRG